jgi:hypothetical protein
LVAWLIVAVTLAVQEQHNLNGQTIFPQSRAERTDYAETSRYQDVMDFLDVMQRQSPLVKVTSFGTSSEGRALPLVILADPPIYRPAEALASGKLIVFVMANIHAGEVEGKEASLHLIREVAGGPLRRLLDKLVILFAPIYNADGNERISADHRPNQKGPFGGVGVRENAQGFDLNRDYMKLESPEASALMQNIFDRWNPHLTIDLHTTNGSYHGYALTYAPPLNPNGHPAPIAYVREKMLPEITRRVDQRYHYKTYFYGNFIDENDPSKGWRTFDHRPRFGNNYVGLRNRMTILSEAYAYDEFRRRVDVTQKFVQTILEYCAERANDMVDIIRRAEREIIARGLSPKPSDQLGVAFEIKPLDHPVDILAYKVVAESDGATGEKKYRRADEIVTYRAQDFGLFESTKKISIPRFYLLASDQQPVVKKLLAHGIAVEELTEPLNVEVEAFIVQEVQHAQRPFQGHRETRLRGRFEKRAIEFPAGSFLITMAQPNANLIFYLLEAESDDGLANWNFFDEYLTSHRQADGTAVYPVYRLHREVNVARRLFE